MPGVKRSSWATGEGRLFKEVCSGSQTPGYRLRRSAKGESSLTIVRGDRSHPCNLEGFGNNQERNADRSTSEGLFGGTIALEEDESWPRAYRFRG